MENSKFDAGEKPNSYPLTYTARSQEEHEQIRKVMSSHLNKQHNFIGKSGQKLLSYLITILFALIFVTLATLPVTFLVQLFGFCVVPLVARNMECPQGFVANSIILGEAAATFAAFGPLIKLLNKPIHLGKKAQNN